MSDISGRIMKSGRPDKGVIIEYLLGRDDTALFSSADGICGEHFSKTVNIRGIIEFSNHCRRGCLYCGLRAGNSELRRFRMSEEEIICAAKEAVNAGYQTLVLQSGEDGYYTRERLLYIIQAVKKLGAAITLSVGERDEDELLAFFNAGADRYLLKHETSDEALYSSLHPEGSLAARVECLRAIKRIGYETGGGFMVGLPGQTEDTIANDLLLIYDIGCDMAGIGPFVPNPKTPLGGESEGSTLLTLRAVALLRHLLPGINLPATTSLGVLDSLGRDMVFSAGANVIMRKVTPVKYRELYEIYPTGKRQSGDVYNERLELEEYVRSLGREPE